MLRSAACCATLIVLQFLAPTNAIGQCQLENPSFELVNSGSPFAAWSRFGAVTANTSLVAHGGLAASVSGPNSGGWDASGLWQQLDSAPGERWIISARVGHRAGNPIVGAATGIINVEWRAANGSLIDFESVAVVDAATPRGRLRCVSFETGPAPAGTASARLVLGFLQSPAQESGAVIFDLISFDTADEAAKAARQWGDFPGGREVAFAGHNWRVKGPGFYGPGPSVFSDATNCVWVDGDGLHLTIRNTGGSWRSTEVTLTEPLGYGDYAFTTVGDLDALAPNVVLGLFLWQYPRCYDGANPWNLHNEIDVEISRWGNPAADVAQFVAQPYDFPGNIRRFGINYAGPSDRVSYGFHWAPDRVEFRAWRGDIDDESPATLLDAWTNTGPHIPRPEEPRMHFNLWQVNGPPSNGQAQQVTIAAFRHTPTHAGTLDALSCLPDCMMGPEAPAAGPCLSLDRDGDQDVDVVDFSDLQRSLP